MVRKTLFEVQGIFKKEGCELLSQRYFNNRILLRYRCSCGNISKIALEHFQNGQRCKQCRYKKSAKANRKSIQEIRNMFNSGGCELIEYIDSMTPVKYRCICGNINKITIGHFRAGQRCRECGLEKNKGSNNPSWNNELTDDEREIRRYYQGYKNWRLEVYMRDNFTCQICDYNKGGNFNAHHKNGYHWCKSGRLDVSNGVTLCNECHKFFHEIYGRLNNTEEQFEKFKLLYFIKINETVDKLLKIS